VENLLGGPKMVSIATHRLPEDRGEGDVTWFLRLNKFQQQETHRQVLYKRTHWPDLPDGHWSRRRGYIYPHILPEGHQEKAFFDPSVVSYLQANDIAFHTESLNLRSSQACCFNFLYPIRQDLDLASSVLKAWLSDLGQVIRIEFEYTGPESVTEWLGEPPGGKRGQNRTSVDAAIWWEDRDGRPRLTLLEWKYTEKEFGPCGGYRSDGNRQKSRCRTVDASSIETARDCYLALGDTHRNRRRYWEHLHDAGIRFQDFEGTGCPFRGPLDQLMRLQLLASWLGSNTKNDIEVAVACFKENGDLMRSPGYLKYLDPYLPSAWQSLLADPNRFRVVFVEDLMAHCNSLPDVARSPWRTYLRERYGV